MKRRLLVLSTLCLILSLPAAARAQAVTIPGTIIFGAWWDSNHDGVVLADTDLHSLFRLNTGPDGAIHTTPITQQDAQVPLVRSDGAVSFFVDRNGLLHNLSRVISREKLIDSAYTPDGGRLIILTQAQGLPNRSISLVDARTGLLIQFTGANVDDTSLSLSPDGTRVLFTQSFFGVNRLYLLDTRTGGVFPLTDGTARISSPRWSPNGASIAYVRQVDTNRNGYDASDPRTLWITDVNAVNQRAVSPPGAVDAGTPVWSPDSFHIAFLHRTDNDANGRITQPDSLQLAVADLTTGIVNIVAAGLDFPTVLWNPSGTRLAFRAVTTDTNGDGFISMDDVPILWVMQANDAVALPLTGGANQVVGGAVAWSPDGNRLAYTVAVRDDNADGRITQLDSTQVYVISTEAGVTRPTSPLIDGPRIGALAWSPDGTALALVVQTSTSLGTLVRADVSNASLAPLTDNTLLADSATGLHWVR
jgi:Tol biopolymer transport system component